MNIRILILDTLLIAVIVMGVFAARNQWRTFEVEHEVSAIEAAPESLAGIQQANAAALTAAPDDWTAIPGQNVFSFDRNDIAILASTEPPQPPGPRPVLFGTMSIGADRTAMVGPGQSTDRSYRAMKRGEVIDGWTITEIQDKAIVISGNQLTETVLMNDPSARVPRERTRTAVTSSAPAQVVTPSQTTTVTPPPGPTPFRVATPPAGMRVIRTPFGDKVVPIEQK